MLRRSPVLTANAGCLALSALLCASPLAAQGALQKRYADWTTYRHEDGQQSVCFAISQPKDMQPKAVQRGAIYFYVSTWPREGVKGEVSVRIGYPFKKGAPATLTVGAESFLLFTKDDRAFVDSPADELRLLEAMKKGQRMVMSGLSERGTTTTDTYSLNGVAQALQQVAQGCP